MLISVIIPVYKVEDLLDRCIESVVNQTYRDLDIILVDDGSPDGCPEKCDIWAQKDARIRVIHKSNAGLSAARNDGIKIASGEYLLFVDSDDYLQLDACEKLATYADGVDVVVGECNIIRSQCNEHEIHTNLQENRIYTGEEYARLAISRSEWYAPVCYNFYRKKLLLENNLSFKEGIYHEDIEFTPRLFLAAKSVKYLHYEFYNYIKRDDSITGRMSEKQFNDLMQTFTSWAEMNNSIENPSTKKAYCGSLAKYYMSTCRNYKDGKKDFPPGIDGKFLRRSALNLKEYIKAVLFSICPQIYVKL